MRNTSSFNMRRLKLSVTDQGAMAAPIDVEKRLTDLEVKASFTEDLVDHLNQIVARQQLHIDRLLQEVARLREQGSAGDGELFRSLRDELPPHY
ncbi:MAG: hypothetical protein Tsb007_23710 [Rhizobacter sp.]